MNNVQILFGILVLGNLLYDSGQKILYVKKKLCKQALSIIFYS